MPNSLFRCLLGLAILIAALCATPPSHAQADDAATFRAACMPKCAAKGHGPNFCGKYCDCNTAEMQKSFGDKIFSRAPAGADAPSADAILAVAGRCSARYVEDYFDAVIAQRCASDEGCAKATRCLAGELRGSGEDESGAILVAVILQNAGGGGDAQKLARYKELTYACQGRDAVKTLDASCRQECGSDAECGKACGCLAGKVGAVGTETQIGELVAKTAEGDVEAKAKYRGMATECGLTLPE